MFGASLKIMRIFTKTKSIVTTILSFGILSFGIFSLGIFSIGLYLFGTLSGVTGASRFEPQHPFKPQHRIAQMALEVLTASEALAAQSPKSELQSTLDKIVKAVQAFPGDPKKEERRTELRKIIDPRFDFQEMARRSLGANWKELTIAQQEEFISLFSELLAKTYLSRIEVVQPGMVKVLGEEMLESAAPSGDATSDITSATSSKAVVRTIVNNKGEEFPIDYKVMLRNDSWRVYDVIIENIGLVANYRSEFAGIIRREKVDGLMLRLREKQ